MGIVQSLISYFIYKPSKTNDTNTPMCVSKLKDIYNAVKVSNENLIRITEELNDYISLDIIRKFDSVIIDNKEQMKIIQSCIETMQSKINAN